MCVKICVCEVCFRLWVSVAADAELGAGVRGRGAEDAGPSSFTGCPKEGHDSAVGLTVCGEPSPPAS